MGRKSISELGIFTGTPLFREKLFVGRPNLGKRDVYFERLKRMFDTKYLSNNGPFLLELESKIAKLAGVKHCICVCNATVGLEVAIKSLDLRGEVIVPSFTFVATAHSLRWFGITPVFCDVDPKTHNLDVKQVERAITPRTTGILPVHLWGQPCDVEAFESLARRKGLKLLFDAAHAFGCSVSGKMIGNFGDAEVYSFHATKFVNAGEGGAIVTNDDALAAKIRQMINFGFVGHDKVIALGTNGKMSEISAALGLTNIESMDEFIDRNRTNHRLYEEGLSKVRGLKLLPFPGKDARNYQYVVVDVDPAETKVTRDQLVDILWAENVFARRYFHPGCHRMMPYASEQPSAGKSLPVTERLSDRILTLPTGTAVGSAEIRQICELLNLLVTNGAKLVEKLDERRDKKRAA